MKKHNNIPLRERMRNADRVYRHEQRLEQREFRQVIEGKNRQFEQEREVAESDKERQEAEAFGRLKALAERREGKNAIT